MTALRDALAGALLAVEFDVVDDECENARRSADALLASDPLSALVRVAEAARAVSDWYDTTHGSEFGHDHHCPLGRGDDAYKPGDPKDCTCGWAAAYPWLIQLGDLCDALPREDDPA